jgi:Trp operon repressor
MFSFTGFECQKLVTKINALLSGDVGDLNVVPDTVQSVALSASGSNELGARPVGRKRWLQEHCRNAESPPRSCRQTS